MDFQKSIDKQFTGKEEIVKVNTTLMTYYLVVVAFVHTHYRYNSF